MNSAAVIPAGRIIFVNRYFYPDESATSQLLSDLCVGLARQGARVHVVCCRQLYDRPDADLPAVDAVGDVNVHRVWTTRFGRDSLLLRAVDYATFYVSSLIALLRLLRPGDTVVAKTDPPLISLVAMLAASIKGARLVNWLQDIFPETATRLGANPLPSFLSGLLIVMRDRSLRAAGRNVVLGERMRDLLIERGIPREKIAIVENWGCIPPAAAVTAVPASQSRLRANLNLGAAFIVGYSGNLGRAHEFDTLLGAARLLRDRRDIRFVLVGGGAGMTALKHGVLTEGLDNCRFLPYQPRLELADSLAAADVHLVSLLPSLEGLIVPSKFYGILAAGRPVVFIGDPDGELARVIRAFGLGAVVGVGDAQGLVAELEKRQRDRCLCELEGASGLRLSETRYSASRALELWRMVLDPAAAEPKFEPLSPAGAALPPPPSNR